MRKYFFIVCALILSNNFFSCKKDSGSSSPAIHSITYKITSNNYQVLSNINYTDTSAPAQSSAVDSISGWSKSITTTYTQFPVQLQVQGQNSSTSTVNYQLSIYIDGLLKAAAQDSAIKFNSFSTQISAVVQ